MSLCEQYTRVIVAGPCFVRAMIVVEAKLRVAG
jgi:hypothetical protein